MKLICFPHAGGFAFYFNFIKQIETLAKEDVFLYEYPGRGYQAKEPSARSLMAIAQTAAARIADFVGDEPFCIFGHSMGAFVADAAIKQMIEAGKAPKKATVVILGITFKENCPDTRNSKVVDIINRLREYDIQPIVADPWADIEVAKQVYGVDLVPFDAIPKADCVIVAVGHNEFRALSLMQLRELFKSELSNDERVLIDVKSLYRMDELKASGLRFWRL